MTKAIRGIQSKAPSHRILIAGPLAATVVTFELRSTPALLPLLDLATYPGQIIFGMHQYFDILNGGTKDCLTWILFEPFFKTATDNLRKHKATAMLTEFGGGPNDACAKIIDKMLTFFDANSDVWVGWTAWSNMYGDQVISRNSSSEYYALTKVMDKYAPLK
ncbi:uncharacterized protein ATNIH1004_001074 [Aspergillus tanneri]|nr:uncharacterized protein ATNIH1004_001074 [Aspergillus tanneri]KAA8652170.1 hypothetical protein ATNIH1004_001074 [Aspergillus tanneri]